MLEVNNKDTRTTPLESFWCPYCLLSTCFTPCSVVSVITFEHVIAGWVILKQIDYLMISQENRS